MSELSQAIQSQVAEMPQNQKLFYNSLLERGEQNVFTAVKGIHKEMKDGSIEPEYQQAASLALAALNETLHGKPKPKVKSNADALKHVQSLIAEAREAGDDSKADMLQNSFDSALAKSEAQIEAANNLRAQNEQTLEAMKEKRQADYEQALALEKDRLIMNYRNGWHMSAVDAEAAYERDDRKKTEAVLKQVYGQS